MGICKDCKSACFEILDTGKVKVHCNSERNKFVNFITGESYKKSVTALNKLGLCLFFVSIDKSVKQALKRDVLRRKKNNSKVCWLCRGVDFNEGCKLRMVLEDGENKCREYDYCTGD
jgi:hypothetical protein